MVWRVLLTFTFFMVGSAVPAQAMLDSGQSGPPLETPPTILAAALALAASLTTGISFDWVDGFFYDLGLAVHGTRPGVSGGGGGSGIP